MIDKNSEDYQQGFRDGVKAAIALATKGFDKIEKANREVRAILDATPESEKNRT
jgi:hypothetical protein